MIEDREFYVGAADGREQLELLLNELRKGGYGIQFITQSAQYRDEPMFTVIYMKMRG